MKKTLSILFLLLQPLLIIPSIVCMDSPTIASATKMRPESRQSAGSAFIVQKRILPELRAPESYIQKATRSINNMIPQISPDDVSVSSQTATSNLHNTAANPSQEMAATHNREQERIFDLMECCSKNPFGKTQIIDQIKQIITNQPDLLITRYDNYDNFLPYEFALNILEDMELATLLCPNQLKHKAKLAFLKISSNPLLPTIGYASLIGLCVYYFIFKK